MLFMNELEVEEATARWNDHPVLGPATKTLHNLMRCANSNSDGWAYWPKPCRAARQLQELIKAADKDRRELRPVSVDAGAVRRAYSPIKAFLTRTKLTIEIVDPA